MKVIPWERVFLVRGRGGDKKGLSKGQGKREVEGHRQMGKQNQAPCDSRGGSFLFLEDSVKRKV